MTGALSDVTDVNWLQIHSSTVRSGRSADPFQIYALYVNMLLLHRLSLGRACASSVLMLVVCGRAHCYVQVNTGDGRDTQLFCLSCHLLML